jgi:hypothetical protein
MSKKLIINLTEAQADQIKKHLSEQSKANQLEETFSGYSFTLSCTEDGVFCWLDLEMNSTVHIGDVSWQME